MCIRDRVLGVINDDSNDVGAVHLGIVHLFELDTLFHRTFNPIRTVRVLLSGSVYCRPSDLIPQCRQ